MAAPNCHCRAADGRSVEVGQEACLKGKLARCEMFLNNTSWKLTGEACPQSQLAPALRLQFAAQRATLPVCKAS